MSRLSDSYKRCVKTPTFFDRFYDTFLAASPMIAPLFKNTNFVKQKELLRLGLSIMVMFNEGQEVGKVVLTRIGKSHGVKEMNIDRNLYKFWIESIVSAVKECDPKFTPEIGREWHTAMEKGVEFMISQDTDPFSL